MPPRSTLLLYTDGLVERRGDSHRRRHGARRRPRARVAARRELDDVADQLMSGLEPSGGYPDDVAMLLYRQPAPLEMDFTADAASWPRAATRYAAG